jgi:hypothetical protein
MRASTAWNRNGKPTTPKNVGRIGQREIRHIDFVAATRIRRLSVPPLARIFHDGGLVALSFVCVIALFRVRSCRAKRLALSALGFSQCVRRSPQSAWSLAELLFEMLIGRDLDMGSFVET